MYISVVSSLLKIGTLCKWIVLGGVGTKAVENVADVSVSRLCDVDGRQGIRDEKVF